jgi:hypothetical protein
MLSSFSISAELASDEKDDSICLIKLQSPHAELNVWVPLTDLPKMLHINDACWSKRTSLQIGRSAASNVFWACHHEQLMIAVGLDDETWDFAFSIPVACFSELLAEVRQVAKEAGLHLEGT